jgi:hypothetical protein
MRWCVALVLIALLVTTVKVAVHKPRRVARAPDDGRDKSVSIAAQGGPDPICLNPLCPPII